MLIAEVIKYLEDFAPLSTAEDFDNVGLLVGSANEELKGILITLDTLETVVDEAIEKKCNLIVSFHPIIFSGLKRINGSNYVERTVIKAIKNNIAIYAIHTALDNHIEGVNSMICDKLKLNNKSILIPKKGVLKKLITYVPHKDVDVVRNSIFNSGAGAIGNYENCSFNIEGIGSFKATKNANPVIGKIDELHFEKETQISITFPSYLENKVVKSLFEAHPYEEVAYEIITLDNSYQNLGLGMTGEFPVDLNENDFLDLIKSTFNVKCIRHSAFLGKKISKIAVLGGSGSFAIDNAKAAGADAFITSDLKYHDYFKAENKILLLDIGHYESEQFTKNLLHSYLRKKISNFALILANTETNPIKYY